MRTILSRLTTLEEQNKVLQERLIAVEERNEKLEATPSLQTQTMEAVLGVSSSIGYQYIYIANLFTL
jgi:hypothetical protein